MLFFPISPRHGFFSSCSAFSWARIKLFSRAPLCLRKPRRRHKLTSEHLSSSEPPQSRPATSSLWQSSLLELHKRLISASSLRRRAPCPSIKTILSQRPAESKQTRTPLALPRVITLDSLGTGYPGLFSTCRHYISRRPQFCTTGRPSFSFSPLPDSALIAGQSKTSWQDQTPGPLQLVRITSRTPKNRAFFKQLLLYAGPPARATIAAAGDITYTSPSTNSRRRDTILPRSSPGLSSCLLLFHPPPAPTLGKESHQAPTRVIGDY